jgi:hypothetical protein
MQATRFPSTSRTPPRSALARGPRPWPQPPSRPRPWLWILCLLPLSLVGILAAFVGLGAVFNLTGTEETVAPGERALMLDIRHLTAWMDGYAPNLASENVTKTRYIDRSYEIQYTYEVPGDDHAPYLSYLLNFEPTKTDAHSTYISLWGGSKAAFLAFGALDVAVDENDEIYQWGDESRFGILRSKGKPFGNVFIARKNKTVVYLLLTGVYFEDNENASELLAPYLEKLDQAPPSS